MQSYEHFTLVERQYLHDRIAESKSLREIAKVMNRNVSSISRELARNRNNDGTYNAWRGSTLYIVRRKRCHKKYRLQQGTDIYDWTIECFGKYWPPEAIVAVWKIKNDGAKLSHSTIYRAIKAGRLQGMTPRTHLRRRGRKKKAHNTATIHPEHVIQERPEIINNRERLGDWEGDTVHGAIGKGGLVTCVERKSKYLTASLLRNYKSETTQGAMLQALSKMPVYSITLDNGSEFAGFREMGESLDATVYFAEPHCPWQRGTNENTNDIVRFFFPRGTNFHNISQDKLDQVLVLINHRPRKCLGWLSPAEILFSKCCT